MGDAEFAHTPAGLPQGDNPLWIQDNSTYLRLGRDVKVNQNLWGTTTSVQFQAANFEGKGACSISSAMRSRFPVSSEIGKI